MNSRRVVVTGVGVISAIGNDRHSFRESLLKGESGIAPLDPANPALGFSQVAAVKDFEAKERLPSRQHWGLDRSAQFALAAAEEAIADSELKWNDELRLKTGVITGCSIGGAITQDDSYRKLYREGKKRAHPMTIPNIMPNSGASHISMEYGFRGPSFTMSTACASSNHAIGLALQQLRSGAIDVAITGGNEAQLNHGSLFAWNGMRVVSPTTCRPFSENPPGMILGEGAAMFVLETLESATKRGAEIYAELAGFGMNSDAHHLTAPSLAGPVAAMRAALNDAELDPSEIDYVNAHGTGTETNDRNEIRALAEVFGQKRSDLAVSSTKSLHGHAIGASGAVEAAATLLAMRGGFLPPTANLDTVDPECPFDVVPNEPKSACISSALSNSFAFGGLNAVLAFRAMENASVEE